MGTIRAMKPDQLPKKYVRTTDRIRSTLKRLVIDITEAPVFARRRRMLSEEVIVNASWLLMKDMDPEELAEKLAPYVAKVEEVFREAEADLPRNRESMGREVNEAVARQQAERLAARQQSESLPIPDAQVTQFTPAEREVVNRKVGLKGTSAPRTPKKGRA